MTSDPQQLTISIMSRTVSTVMGRMALLNEEYPAEDFLADMTRMVFKELGTGRKVTRFRAALHNEYVQSLIGDFKAAGAQSAARPHLLQTLKQLKVRTASAGGDSATRAHYANLNDLITRALEVK